MAAHNPKTSYSESAIRVLKGLEPVKQRPGMYTRTESPLHVVQEVIDKLQAEIGNQEFIANQTAEILRNEMVNLVTVSVLGTMAALGVDTVTIDLEKQRTLLDKVEYTLVPNDDLTAVTYSIIKKEN